MLDEDGDPLKRFRFTLRASGTIKVIKLGNIASGAASFVLEKGDSLADLEFWGVAAFQTNFEFLEQYGIYAQRQRAAARSTRPTTRSARRSRSRASRAASSSRCRPRAYAAALASLPTDTFNPIAAAGGWIDAVLAAASRHDLDADGIDARRHDVRVHARRPARC